MNTSGSISNSTPNLLKQSDYIFNVNIAFLPHLNDGVLSISNKFDSSLIKGKLKMAIIRVAILKHTV